MKELKLQKLVIYFLIISSMVTLTDGEPVFADSVVHQDNACFSINSSLEIDHGSLNGAGYRKKGFLKIYFAELYLPNKCHDPALVIQADQPMSVTLKITSSLVTPTRMREAIMQGVKQSAGAEFDSALPLFENALAVFDDNIRKGDVFRFSYQPGHGTDVSKNNEYRLTIKGLFFKRVLFGIWLGPNPVDPNLKNKLLEIKG